MKICFLGFLVSLDVRTCELFLCFVAIVRVRAIVLAYCKTWSGVEWTGVDL